MATAQPQQPLQPPPELNNGFCLSCCAHCDFVVVDVSDAKNPKTEICKGFCLLLKQKPVFDADGKPVLDDKGEKMLT